jgi:hypothetical protein
MAAAYWLAGRHPARVAVRTSDYDAIQQLPPHALSCLKQSAPNAAVLLIGVPPMMRSS